MTIRYRRVGLKIERVPDAEREGLLAEAEDVRDAAALMEVEARSARRRAQVLVAGLLADHRRRRAAHQTAASLGPEPAPGLGVTSVQLRRARQVARISQRQLAAACGYSRGAIASYEDNLSPHRMPEAIRAWVRQVLRASGEWPEPEGGTPE